MHIQPILYLPWQILCMFNVNLKQDNAAYDPTRINAFQCDLTQDDLKQHIPECNVDVVTMLFVLSAIHPDKMKEALQNVYSVS